LVSCGTDNFGEQIALSVALIVVGVDDDYEVQRRHGKDMLAARAPRFGGERSPAERCLVTKPAVSRNHDRVDAAETAARDARRQRVQA
jgi:hypothetical protein